MASIFEYLAWRGDLSFKQAPFNAVDNILCSMLSYLPMDGIVPGPEERTAPFLGTVMDRIAASAEAAAPNHRTRNGAGGEGASVFSDKRTLKFVRALSSSNRYRNLRLMGYASRFDVSREKQFAAVTILSPRRFAYVSYRGTDDTLIGWKEDFNMSFTPVPSQLEAAAYLETMAKRISMTPLLPGGHSKGGNLAVYAASFCRRGVRRRIAAVYNNDGPGFNGDVLAARGYEAVKDRIQTFVPQSSVFGMIFEHDDDYTVVKSTQTGIMQHDLYSWEVGFNDVVRLDRITQKSRFVDRTIKDWIGGLDVDQRRIFVDALFDILKATKARSFTELSSNWLKSAVAMVQGYNTIDDATKTLIGKTLGVLFESVKHNFHLLVAGDEKNQ
ncbi:MAG: DUF2974 domain-containing protein [Treponema sp.]|jgi:hypothetical protein|nr:DUF2974 domain-containing protein [Treponema sp.]